MNIQGLQKLTLLDYPGKVACTVFLGGCDLRCRFCHNSSLLDGGTPGSLELRNVLDFLATRRKQLDGVCITGGEPLLQPDLVELLKAIRELGFAVKLDTNGSRPERLYALVEAKLVDYVAMDVKNSPQEYARTVGVPHLDLTPFRESAAYLLSEPVDYEFRTTVVREFHNEASFQAIGPWIAGARRYFLQNFVDQGTVLQPGLHAWDKESLQRFLEIVKPYVRHAELRGV